MYSLRSGRSGSPTTTQPPRASSTPSRPSSSRTAPGPAEASSSSPSWSTSPGSTTPACTNPSATGHPERSRNYTLRKTGQPHPRNEHREPTKTVSMEPRAAHYRISKGIWVVRNTYCNLGSTMTRLSRLLVARCFSTVRRASRRGRWQSTEEARMSGVRGLGLKCLVCAVVGLAGSPVAGLAAGSSPHERDLLAHRASLRRGVSGRRGSSTRAAGGLVHRAASRRARRGHGRRFRRAHRAPRVSKARSSTVAGSVSLRASPLVIPGSPGEVEQLKAEQEAKLANPEAVMVREESRLNSPAWAPNRLRRLMAKLSRR